MSELKLTKLPDRTPVKLVILVTPELHSALHDYAGLYREVYGVEEAMAELIPHMLASFLSSDREFARRRR